MYSRILSRIICTEFEKVLGKSHWEDKASFKMVFDLVLDWDKEDGYRWADLVIYAPCNYVAVFVRERWNVRTRDKKELKGESDWKCLCYHDSCWMHDGVDSFFNEYKDRIICLGNYTVFDNNWYKIEPIAEEIYKNRLWKK